MPDTITQGVRHHDPVADEGPARGIQYGSTDRLATWDGLRSVATLTHEDRRMRVEAGGHGHRDTPLDPEASRMEVVAGEGVAVFDAVNRPPRARPRGRGWRRVTTAAVVLAGLVAGLSPLAA